MPVWSWVNRRLFKYEPFLFKNGCSANFCRAPYVIRGGGVGLCLHSLLRYLAAEGPGNSKGIAHC